MFKGFGKPKYTADERQMAGGATLTHQLKKDEFLLSKLNAGTNQVYLLFPDNDSFMEYDMEKYQYSLGEGTVRWDLLNPGCPDLVGIRMYTKCGRLKALEASRNCFTAIYDRAKKIVTIALQVDFLSETDSGCMSIDLTSDELLTIEEPPERHAKALNRFTHWSSYDMARSMVSRDDLDRQSAIVDLLRDKMGSDWDEVFVSV